MTIITEEARKAALAYYRANSRCSTAADEPMVITVNLDKATDAIIIDALSERDTLRAKVVELTAQNYTLLQDYFDNTQEIMRLKNLPHPTQPEMETEIECLRQEIMEAEKVITDLKALDTFAEVRGLQETQSMLDREIGAMQYEINVLREAVEHYSNMPTFNKVQQGTFNVEVWNGNKAKEALERLKK